MGFGRKWKWEGRRPNDPDYVSNDALRSMCDDVLLLLSTTVDNMQGVLWPYLLECIVPEQYTDAMATVCRTIGHIAGKKREEKAEDYDVDFKHRSNIPKPPVLTARLMVMAGHPMSGRRRGVHVLTAMKALSPLLHESLVELWDAVIPKLIQYVKDGQDKEDEGEWSQKNWEDLLLKLLSKSLEELSDDTWTCNIGQALMEQLSQCTSCAEDKNFLLKCLGVVMRRATTTRFVQQSLYDAFSYIQHFSQLEREGFAIAAGFAAAAHLDTALEVIARLDASSKKPSGGLFSFIKRRQANEYVDWCRCGKCQPFGTVARVCLLPKGFSDPREMVNCSIGIEHGARDHLRQWDDVCLMVSIHPLQTGQPPVNRDLTRHSL
ncbi:Maestro heat-like repeat-containing protein family member 1 [Lamellibrachia satsuma]|nr:Maestro heat-like repeat-containing protein family member 1 [Lamellibrachia satsuma]